jgi:hypothetical protein
VRATMMSASMRFSNCTYEQQAQAVGAWTVHQHECICRLALGNWLVKARGQSREAVAVLLVEAALPVQLLMACSRMCPA